MTRQIPRLVAIATHPIQYHAPLFRALAGRSEIEFEAAFVEIPDARSQGRGFGVAFQWDVPLLDGYRSRVLPSRGPGLARGFFGRRLVNPKAALRALDADVLLMTGWQAYALVQATRAARALGIPMLIRGESSGLKPRGWAVRALHRRLLASFQGFLAIGHANEHFYLSNGVAREKLMRAPYFVDNEFFASRADAQRPRRDELRREWGIPADATCFVFVGKLEAKKHPEHLLQALATARRLEPSAKVHVLVVGAGALEPELREAVSRESLPVTFAGFLNQSEVARAYACADALVLPSNVEETWGLVVNEAMACGLPAIVSDQVGCGPDLVGAERGAVYPFGSVERLARLLLEWCGDPAGVRRMGEAARDYIAKHHTVERTAEAVVEAAQRVLCDQPKHDVARTRLGESSGG